MKNFLFLLTAGFAFLLFLNPTSLSAQSDMYDEGSVWNLTFIKLKANMGDDYLKGLKQTWKRSMDMMVQEKVIKSYKVLMGSASNKSDFDLLLLVESENFASLDPNPETDKKVKDIEKKVMDAMGDEYKKTIVNYETLREITGNKVMREIFLK